MIVVDASVLVTALVDVGPAGRAVRARLVPGPLASPDLIDLEVLSAVRSMVLFRRLAEERAHQVLADLVDLPLQRAPHRSLLHRCWELRDNLTVYDASYVALAELLEAPLLTADARLAGAPGLRCDVQLLSTP